MLLQGPVRAVRARLTELLAEWPDHPLLVQLAAIADRLLGEREAQSVVCPYRIAFACRGAKASSGDDGLGTQKAWVADWRASSCITSRSSLGTSSLVPACERIAELLSSCVSGRREVMRIRFWSLSSVDNDVQFPRWVEFAVRMSVCATSSK